MPRKRGNRGANAHQPQRAMASSFERRFDTPRQSKPTALKELPTDVYLLIFDYLRVGDVSDDDLNSLHLKKAVWRKIARVCRFFRAQFLPLLFSNTSNACVPFCKSIANAKEESLHLPQYIRSFTFYPRSQSAAPDNLTTFASSSIDLKAARCMTNITSLTFYDVVLNIPMIEFICSLPNLTSLRFFHGVDIVKNIPPQLRYRFVSLKLTNLHMDTPSIHAKHTDSFWKDCVSTFRLRNLYLNNSKPVIGHFLKQGNADLLEILTTPITRDTLESFEELLGTAPSLTKLHIDCTTDCEQRISLAVSSLPSLREIECPPHWLPDIVPGRPVEFVDTTSHTHNYEPVIDYIQLVSALNSSTATIKRMHLLRDHYIGLIKTPGYPRAWVSEVVIPDKPSLDMNFEITEHKPAFDFLKNETSKDILRLDIENFFPVFEIDLKDQLKLIQKCILPVLPNVQIIKLSHWIEWRRDLIPTSNNNTSNGNSSSSRRRGGSTNSSSRWRPFPHVNNAANRGATLHSFISMLKKFPHEEISMLLDHDRFFSRIVLKDHPDYKFFDKLSKRIKNQLRGAAGLLEEQLADLLIADAMYDSDDYGYGWAHSAVDPLSGLLYADYDSDDWNQNAPSIIRALYGTLEHPGPFFD